MEINLPRLFRWKSGVEYDPFDWKMNERIKELETEFKVLDHGFVKYINHMGTEEDIIRAARQSTQKDFLGWGQINHKFEGENPNDCQREFFNPNAPAFDGDRCHKPKSLHSGQGDEKLLEYLYKNKHTTPFEMLELCIQVKVPIFVIREWHRHRTQSYNEMSGRYIQMPDEHYVPDIRWQDTKNRQGSTPYKATSEMADVEENIYFQETIKGQQADIYTTYEHFINKQGIAKEVARINTPVSRYTVMYAKANLHNWLHFLNLRLRPNAQWEIRQYAQAVASIIKQLWPRTYELFEEYTLHSVSLSRNEAEVVRRALKDYRLFHCSESPDSEMAAEELRIEEKLGANIW